jgi:2-haloacid dehalogenase
MPVRVVLFDVNETLSEMTPLRRRLGEAQFGAWFAGVLRDGISLTAAGGFATFRDIAADGLRGLGASDQGVEQVLDGFTELDVHPDVPEGVRALRAAGLRLATLTNGSVAITERLLERAALREEFERLLDVSGPQAWKPAGAAYRYALEQLGAEAAETVLVAVHPWDVDGAMRAGLRGAWVRRGAAAYPSVMTPPTYVVEDLTELAAALGA